MFNTVKKRESTKGMLFKGAFIPKLLDNPLGSYCLINFLLSHTAHFDKNIIPPFFVLETLGFVLSVFFDTSNNTITLFYK